MGGVCVGGAVLHALPMGDQNGESPPRTFTRGAPQGHPPRGDVPWDIHEVHPGLSPKVFQGDLPGESPNNAPQVVKISKEKLG